MTNCGAGCGESCSASLQVPGGTYYRTYTNDGGGASGVADPATVSGFRLDKYDVTVGRFRPFVKAWDNGSGYLPPAGSGKHTHLNAGNGLANSGSTGTYESGWVASDNQNITPTQANLICNPAYATWTSVPGASEKKPITCVNWWEAYAFCVWDGGFLPSEAEWEYAGAGGSAQREYPWGAAAPGNSNQYAIYGCYYPAGAGPCSSVTNVNTAPVGTAASGAGLWGQLDLAGNMSQWTLDVFATYATCQDCAYLSPTVYGYRVLRGGYAALGDASYLLATFRDNYVPAFRTYSFGFRCARTP